MKTLVLGLGNILLQDEGVGVRVIERLQADYAFPEEVTVLHAPIPLWARE